MKTKELLECIRCLKVRFSNRKAFNFIEITFILVILTIIDLLTFPVCHGRSPEKHRLIAAEMDINITLYTALSYYQKENGSYPSTEEGLYALIKKPTSPKDNSKWDGPYLKKSKYPTDPWGNKYIYICPGIHNPHTYDLYSYGKDGVESSDDVNNWSESD